MYHLPRPQLERQRPPAVVAGVELRPVRRQRAAVVHVHRVPCRRPAFAAPFDLVRLLDAEFRGGCDDRQEGEEGGGEAHCLCFVCRVVFVARSD